MSVPNARHFSLVRDLVLRGTFGYTEWGHRDNTHLRWFTRRDIVAAVGDAGWIVEGTSHPALRRGAEIPVPGWPGRANRFIRNRRFGAPDAAPPKRGS